MPAFSSRIAAECRITAPSIYQPLRSGKLDNRHRPRNSAVINAAEPDDNQIFITQIRHLTGRRDESHRLMATQLCVSRLQAESYLAADLRAEPGYATSLGQYLAH
jgi:hypothetical protein